MQNQLSVPIITEEVPELRLSVSKVKTFTGCKKQFFYNYIQKLPKKTHEYHTFGKFCHKVLEDFHLAYIAGSQEPFNKMMTACFKNALVEYQEHMSEQMKTDCKAILLDYLKIVSQQQRDNTLPNVIACEKDFSFDLRPGVKLIGFIDRLQVDPDGVLHVLDYKTSKSKKYLAEDFFQLITYAYALLVEDPSITKIRGSYMMLKHNFDLITTEFGQEEILAIKDQYLDYANKILEEKEYKAKPTVLCSYCDFLDVCPEGKQQTNRFIKHGETSW
jgi:putative RecB family exonuclease